MLVPKISEPKQDIVILFALPLLQNFYSQTSCSLTLCWPPSFSMQSWAQFSKKETRITVSIAHSNFSVSPSCHVACNGVVQLLVIYCHLAIQSWPQTQSVSFFNSSPLTSYALNSYVENFKLTSWQFHVVAGPLGNSSFCFPKNCNVFWNEKHCDLKEANCSKGPVIKCLVMQLELSVK